MVEVREALLKMGTYIIKAVHYGYLPFILYVGYARTMPKPALIRIISPLA